MLKKILILFPSKKEKTISKQHAAAKEKENIINVLGAGDVKKSSGDFESSSQFHNLQVNDVSGLLADAENTPFIQTKKGTFEFSWKNSSQMRLKIQ